MIKTNTQLSHYLDYIKNETLLAIDTEFRRVDSYYPELCLIQIASKGRLECFDVLSIDNLEPLFNKLYDNKTKWIVHLQGKILRHYMFYPAEYQVQFLIRKLLHLSLITHCKSLIKA